MKKEKRGKRERKGGRKQNDRERGDYLQILPSMQFVKSVLLSNCTVVGKSKKRRGRKRRKRV